MAYPPPQPPYGTPPPYGAPQAFGPYPGYRPPAPGSVTAARTVLWIQGALWVISTLFFAVIILIALGFSDSTSNDTSRNAYVTAVLVGGVILTVIPGTLAFLAMFFAARMKRGRSGTRVAALVMEGILGVLGIAGLLATCYMIVRHPNGAEATGLVFSVLSNALPWTVFFCLMQDSAKQYLAPLPRW
jgi:hypothetical protein